MAMSVQAFSIEKGKAVARLEIAVCFKIVPDYEEMIPTDWDDMDHLDFAFVKKMYGCYDEAALETALRLKNEWKEAGKEVRCVAVTVGKGTANLLTGLYAAGFDEVVCITGAEYEFSPQETAKELSSYLKEKNPDLIFTGRVVGPCDSGMVPAYLASQMGFEWMNEVTELCYNKEEDRLEVWTEDADFETCRVLTLPAVCTVGDAKHPYLRIFSLKERLEARTKNVTKRAAFASKNQRNVLEAFVEEKRENICTMIEKETVEESAVWLLKAISGEV